MGFYSLLYNIGLGAYHTGIKLSAPFNAKARQWVDGRQDWLNQLQEILNGKPVVWVHCASLGEYEQGKPVIEALETEYPQRQLVVSFYSPSGYEVVKNREPNRTIIYLPADSEVNAKAFLKILNPKLAIFIKYEFWYHYLQQLRHRRVPTLLVSGIFRIEQPFFKPWGVLHKQMLECFAHFFVQDGVSEYLLKDIGFQNVSVSGDTRFDRVGAILKHPKPLPVIEKFKSDAPLFVAGSTWPADEDVLQPMLPALIAKGWRVVIAPHDVDAKRIHYLQTALGQRAITYSAAEKGGMQKQDVLIIDNVGLLAHIYKYAELAFIGGGFGKGIHNILEAAASGLPVIIGPNYRKFKEAKDLIDIDGAFSIKNTAELEGLLNELLNEEPYFAAANAAQQYVQDNTGATQKVMQWVKENAEN